jgi:hypothetical protein
MAGNVAYMRKILKSKVPLRKHCSEQKDIIKIRMNCTELVQSQWLTAVNTLCTYSSVKGVNFLKVYIHVWNTLHGNLQLLGILEGGGDNTVTYPGFRDQ